MNIQDIIRKSKERAKSGREPSLIKGVLVGLGVAASTLIIALLLAALAVVSTGCGPDFETPGERCDRHFRDCVERLDDNYRAARCRDNYAVCMFTSTSTGGAL